MFMDFPEPLFETDLHDRRVCMACAQKHAVKILRTTNREIVPICEDCSSAWNVHGYQILKRIRPVQLMKRIVWFKLRNLLGPPSWRTICRDLTNFKEWAAKMRRWT